MSSVVLSPSLPQSRTQIAVTCYSTCCDTDLVRGLVENDSAAWQALGYRYGRLIQSCIHRVIARFPSVVRADDANEIISMLYVQLLSNDRAKLRTFDPERGCKLGTWLGLLATHTAYDFLRSVRKVPRGVELTEAEELATDSPDPAEITLRSERASSVAAVLAEFTHKDREFVELYFGEGLDPDEVARRMGISVKTVYSKKHKIQRRLADLLGGPRLAA
ncbi:MAG TPA: sigma-70 family RNA polymerase sigma factor [Polyangiaceae bacterium]|jgi:RNA polymerase sigma-70 factor (ECF subfamily)|nr:sigma-70 family RNA polymerase sigma factor [Polyangiaceae bacterium]